REIMNPFSSIVVTKNGAKPRPLWYAIIFFLYAFLRLTPSLSLLQQTDDFALIPVYGGCGTFVDTYPEVEPCVASHDVSPRARSGDRGGEEAPCSRLLGLRAGQPCAPMSGTKRTTP